MSLQTSTRPSPLLDWEMANCSKCLRLTYILQLSKACMHVYGTACEVCMWFEDNIIKNNCKNFISEIQIVATKNAKQALHAYSQFN